MSAEPLPLEEALASGTLRWHWEHCPNCEFGRVYATLLDCRAALRDNERAFAADQQQQGGEE